MLNNSKFSFRCPKLEFEMSEEVNKKLKLHIGIVKRLQKELASYEKEALKQEAKIQKMRDEDKDFYGSKFNCLFCFSLSDLNFIL